MGEIFSDGDGTLSLCCLDASWARRAADFDARIFPVGVSPSRHCEPADRQARQSIMDSCQRCEASNQVSIDRHVGAERLLATTDCICCYCDVESAWPFEVWQEMLSNPELSFFAYVRPAEGMQTHGDIVALGGISSGNTPEILTLGVEQSYRGQGLGAKLLDFLIAQAQKNTNATHITLEVRADNEAALALYTSRGFTSCATAGNVPTRRCEEARRADEAISRSPRSLTLPRDDGWGAKQGIRKAQLSLIKKL